MKIDLQWAFTWADMPAGPCVLCEAEFEPRAVLIRCDPHGAEACEGCLRALSGRKDAFPGAPWPTWEEYEALVAAHPEPMFSSAEQVAASEEETADPETGRWPAYDASLLWMAADQVLSAPVFGVATTPAEHLGQDWREVPRAEMFDRVIVAVDGAKAGAEGVGDRAFARPGVRPLRGRGAVPVPRGRARAGRRGRGQLMYVELNAERVRALREEQGMTKRDLAAAAGVSPTTARNAERGMPVQSNTARKLAAALGVNPPQRLGRPAHRS